METNGEKEGEFFSQTRRKKESPSRIEIKCKRFLNGCKQQFFFFFNFVCKRLHQKCEGG
ncbi:hypothetical protein JOE21_000957 [Desmospora profundinema]|uniref:Uncharacterized protein n=1 Tax=Desmospora profundinema TaxID=1571184 RepID=A0ABU1IJM5_9BACL|nr:hypothetical protein [Desmospora profundinema]